MSGRIRAGSSVRTNDFGPCAKREVSYLSRMSRAMLAGKHPRRVVGGAALVAVSALLLAGVVPVAGTALGGGVSPVLPTELVRSAGAFEWSNGHVAVDFPSAAPVFSVSSASNASLAVSQTLGGLAEVNPSGQIVSMASFLPSRLSWNLTHTYGPQGTTVLLRSDVPVLSANGEWESGDDSPSPSDGIGNVSVSIAFTLNDSSGPSPSTVAYSLNVSAWPWYNGNDSLGLEVRSNLSATIGYWQASGTRAVTGISRATSDAFVRFSWGASARTFYANGNEGESSVGTYHNYSANGSSSLVRLDFTPVEGGYSALSYDPWVELLTPGPTEAGLAAVVLTPLSLGALVTGAAVTGVLAWVARRRRVPPETGL